jgi:hypothetical protein
LGTGGAASITNGNTGTVLWSLEIDNRLRCNAEINVFSDRRAKNHIAELDGTRSLKAVQELRAVCYTWKEGYGSDDRAKLGFYAQEVGEAGIGEAVTNTGEKRGDIEDYLVLDKDQLLAVLWSAVRQLSQEVKELQNKH